MLTSHHRITRLAGLIAAAAVLGLAFGQATATARTRGLTRYPYLTDVVPGPHAERATINWATDQSRGAAFVRYRRHGTRAARTVKAIRSAIVVNGKPEYQWKARIRSLRSDTRYDYRVFFRPRLDLLGRWRTFRTPPAPESSTPFSFAVLGDWGAANTAGAIRAQVRLHALIAASPARFVLSAGDVAYPRGTQTNYGDLSQTGPSVSQVFGPRLYKRTGMSRSMFAAPGNHGFTDSTLDVWPEDTAVRMSGGRYQMDTYSIPGTKTRSYPSAWYAFTVGGARFYILTAAWPNLNRGTGTLYSNDYQAHWTQQSPEYLWLAHDLATHPAALKFATFHFPMYADHPFESTDPYLHGPGSLAELLTQYGVQFVFNGHAHIYERNYQQPGESFVSYVVGAGGESLERIGPSSAFDAYGLGWSASLGQGFATGSAPVPTSASQVYSFVLVTVSGTQVTVKGVNALGQSFDTITYQF